MAEPHHRDFGFFYWAAVGFLIAFGALAILSIGAPLLLLGLVLLIGGLWRGPRWPADLGPLAGVGLVCVLIALIGSLGAVGIWALVGLALISLGGGGFWWLRCRPAVR